MTRPVGAPQGWSEASLNDSASDWIKSQVGDEKDFGTLDGGNCGLTAYVFPEAKAQAVLTAAKEMYPGAKDFQAASFDNSKLGWSACWSRKMSPGSTSACRAAPTVLVKC